MQMKLDEKVPKTKYNKWSKRIGVFILFPLFLCEVILLSLYPKMGLLYFYERFGKIETLVVFCGIVFLVVSVDFGLNMFFGFRENPDFFAIGERRKIFVRNNILFLFCLLIILLLIIFQSI